MLSWLLLLHILLLAPFVIAFGTCLWKWTTTPSIRREKSWEDVRLRPIITQELKQGLKGHMEKLYRWAYEQSAWTRARYHRLNDHLPIQDLNNMVMDYAASLSPKHFRQAIRSNFFHRFRARLRCLTPPIYHCAITSDWWTEEMYWDIYNHL